MWHIGVGIGILFVVLSLMFAGLYKLSGTNNICKRGQWGNDGDESAENHPARHDHVEWLELQVNGDIPNSVFPGCVNKAGA